MNVEETVKQIEAGEFDALFDAVRLDDANLGDNLKVACGLDPLVLHAVARRITHLRMRAQLPLRKRR